MNKIQCSAQTVKIVTTPCKGNSQDIKAVNRFDFKITRKGKIKNEGWLEMAIFLS